MKSVMGPSKMRVLFMILAWIGLPLLIIEIVLRIFFPLNYASIYDAFQYDETLGFCVKTGFHVKVTDHRQEFYVNNLKTVNFQDSFKDYKTIIFALGDSYTQGTGNPMDCSYPFQLDFVLNRDKEGIYHRRYAVVNLALSSFGAKQSFLTMKRYMKLIGKPTVVLYLGCDNDVEDDALFDSGYKHRNFVDGSPYWGWLVNPIQWMDNFQTFRYVKYIIMNSVSQRIICNEGKNRLSSVSAAEAQWPAIKKIHQECQKLGAKLVLSWVYSEDSYHWLKTKAAAEGIDFADWYPAAENIQRNFDNLPINNDHSGGHYRPWVNRIIADEFAKHIVSLEESPK